MEAHRPGADRVPRADVRGARERHHGDYYGVQVVSDEEVERGVAEGRLVVDTRLRDALRQIGTRRTALAFPTPSLVDEATYAVEAAVLGEADVVRLQRRLDTLEQRLATVERGLPNRIYRKASRRAGKSAPRRARGRLTARSPITTS